MRLRKACPIPKTTSAQLPTVKKDALEAKAEKHYYRNIICVMQQSVIQQNIRGPLAFQAKGRGILLYQGLKKEAPEVRVKQHYCQNIICVMQQTVARQNIRDPFALSAKGRGVLLYQGLKKEALEAWGAHIEGY